MKNFRLSTIFVLILFCAILLAWLVDHQKLVKQIPVPKTQLVIVYQMSTNAKTIAAEIESLYGDASIVLDPADSKKVIVVASREDHDRIEALVKYHELAKKITKEIIEAQTAQNLLSE